MHRLCAYNFYNLQIQWESRNGYREHAPLHARSWVLIVINEIEIEIKVLWIRTRRIQEAQAILFQTKNCLWWFTRIN